MTAISQEASQAIGTAFGRRLGESAAYQSPKATLQSGQKPAAESKPSIEPEENHQ
jgi:hypothetical protein